MRWMSLLGIAIILGLALLLSINTIAAGFGATG